VGGNNQLARTGAVDVDFKLETGEEKGAFHPGAIEILTRCQPNLDLSFVQIAQLQQVDFRPQGLVQEGFKR
jgi:hypothetical protein